MAVFTITLQDAVDQSAVVELQIGNYIKGSPGEKGNKGDTGDVTPAAQTARDQAQAAQAAAATSEANAGASALSSANSATAATAQAAAAGNSATSANASANAAGSSAAAADASKTAAAASAASAANAAAYELATWAYAQTFQLVSATRDTNGAITTATIKWPDGVSGVFTTDVASTSFPGAIDAWHATYLGTTTKTVTQPAVTRDTNGAVTVQPAITIS